MPTVTERKRLAYRPPVVRVLLIGESPPANGTFFYDGDSILACYTREAFDAAIGRTRSSDEFLAGFRDLGCYLLDLCPSPVNNLDSKPRAAARQVGIRHLTEALHGLRPELVLIVMKEIEPEVVQALDLAGLGDVRRHVLPFPAYGHDGEYVSRLASLLRHRKRVQSSR